MTSVEGFDNVGATDQFPPPVAPGKLKNKPSEGQNKETCAGAMREREYESTKQVYKMEKNPHGQAVIFNFIGETHPVPSKYMHFPVGSRNSVKKFAATFEDLGYNVHKYPFLSREDMIRSLTDSIVNGDDSFVCCIMAHGKEGNIIARNDELVDIRDLQREVGKKCPKLFGKPKIFIVQACRGGDIDQPMGAVQYIDDEALPTHLSREADFFIAYSTTEDHIATINPHSGCIYLNTLCTVFKEKADHLSLDEMVMKVHHTLEENLLDVEDGGQHIQMGQVMHTLRGPVRFCR